MSHTFSKSRIAQSCSAIFLGALLTACGGGGSSDAAPQAANNTQFQQIASEDSPAVSGERGVALAEARFNNPTGIATMNGDFYVADSGNHTIRKISSAGTVLLLAGSAGLAGNANGTGESARFNNPQGIAVDLSGNVFVADTGNHVIRKITPAGTVTTVAGTPGVRGNADGSGPAAQFNMPSGIAADASGNLYVTDTENYLIRKITPAGSVSTLAGIPNQRGRTNGSVASATFINPLAIAIDVTGNLYITDGYFYPPEPNTIAEIALIRKITPAGTVSTVAGDFVEGPRDTDGTGSTARFYRATGLVAAPDGNVYVADTKNNLIRKITPDATVTTLVDTGAGLQNPQGITSDASGNLYIADSSNHVIRRVSVEGTVTNYAGKAGESGAN